MLQYIEQFSTDLSIFKESAPTIQRDFPSMRDICVKVDDKDLKQRFGPYVDQCILILKSDPKAELFVEVLGCLANLSLPKFNFGDLVQRHDLLNFLAEFAKPGMVEDDILLEVVMFVGAPHPR